MSLATAMRQAPTSTVFDGDQEVCVASTITQPTLRALPEKVNVITISADLLGCVEDVVSATAQRRIAALLNDVENMKLLHSDWNAQGSEPPNAEAVESAQAILLSATSVIVPTRVTASAQGGVGICFYRGKKYGDIECLNTGEIFATISDGSGRPQVWEVRLNESKGALERIGQFIYS